MRFTGVLALLGVAATLACGDDDDPTDPGDGAGDFTVSVVNNAFNPSTLSVPAGSTVNWNWNSAGIVHNVTFEDGHPPSPDQSSGTYSRNFSATGDYAYVCTLHAAQGMAGVVSVTSSTTGGTGDGGTGDGGTGGGGYP